MYISWTNKEITIGYVIRALPVQLFTVSTCPQAVFITCHHVGSCCNCSYVCPVRLWSWNIRASSALVIQLWCTSTVQLRK